MSGLVSDTKNDESKARKLKPAKVRKSQRNLERLQREYFVSSGFKYFVVYMWGSESWDMMWALINAKIMWDKDSAKPKTEKKLSL